MNKSLSPNSSIVNRTIDLNYANKQRAESIKWIFVNIVLFLLFAYDLGRACWAGPLQWAEGAASAVLAANVVQHAWRVARSQRHRPPPDTMTPTPAPVSAPPSPVSHEDTRALCAARAWRTPDSSPPPSPPSPDGAFSSSPRLERLNDSDEFIADRRSLANYLREREERSRVEEGGEGGRPPGAHHHHHPLYQLAPLHNSEGSPLDEGGAGAGAAQAAGAWRRLRLDPRRVTQWEQNLRLWLHLSVLRRLEQEMARVDEALGPGARLGDAPLERLRRAPAAAALLPYLERFADQRYVVRRVRELARGGCLSEYRWAGGGAGWDEARPADAELVLRLLAAYLDAQLAPLPPVAPPPPLHSAHHARAFTAAHLSAAPAPPPRGPHALVVHRVTDHPPHYVLVHGDDVIEVSRGRNNMLHTVLLFIAAAARSDPPALQRLHLGPAGLNLLWVIGR